MADEISTADAVSRMTAALSPSSDEPRQQPEAAAPARSEEPESSVVETEDDTGPDNEPVPGESETEEQDDPAREDEPSIDPPRSWSKEYKDVFKALPTHLQQMVADSERAREADFLRRQSEAETARKTAEAERQTAERARQQYEQALPNLLNQFTSQFHAEFPDIKSWNDVKDMQNVDPLRYQRWQVLYEQGKALAHEAEATKRRSLEEEAGKYKAWAMQETEKFLAVAPEFRDKAKAPALIAEAEALLADIGFSRDEQDALWNGQPVYAMDSRFKLLMRDAMKWRSAEKARKAAVPKQPAQVQRPGVAQPIGERGVTELKTLKERVSKSGKTEDAVAFLKARIARGK